MIRFLLINMNSSKVKAILNSCFQDVLLASQTRMKQNVFKFRALANIGKHFCRQIKKTGNPASALRQPLVMSAGRLEGVS